MIFGRKTSVIMRKTGENTLPLPASGQMCQQVVRECSGRTTRDHFVLLPH